MATERTKLFICYSHQDAAWLERLRVHLKPLVDAGLVEAWDDSRIQPGVPWREAIATALASARAAVILVSADLLASEFIRDHELPPLLEGSRTGRLRLLPVMVRSCMYDIPPLGDLQFVNDPKVPLASLGKAAAEAELVGIARKVMEAVAGGVPGPVAGAVAGVAAGAKAGAAVGGGSPNASGPAAAAGPTSASSVDPITALLDRLKGLTRAQFAELVLRLGLDASHYYPDGTEMGLRAVQLLQSWRGLRRAEAELHRAIDAVLGIVSPPAPPAAPPSHPLDLITARNELAELLKDRFRQHEREALLHSLGVDPDDVKLGAPNAETYARAMVTWFDGRGRLAELWDAVKRERPIVLSGRDNPFV